MKLPGLVLAFLMFVAIMVTAALITDAVSARATAIRNKMGLSAKPETVLSGSGRQPLVMLVMSQLYTGINLQLEDCSISKYPRRAVTCQSLYFASTSATRCVVIDITYHRNAQDAQQALFQMLAVSSAPDETIAASMTHITNGPGDLCVASKYDGRRVLFTRGNAFVQILNTKGPTDGLLDVARWLDAQFASLSSNAAALTAADPCETNDMSFASFIVYDIPEPDVEPLANDAQ